MVRSILLLAILITPTFCSSQLQVNTGWGNTGLVKLSMAEFTEPVAISITNNDSLMILCNTIDEDTTAHKTFMLIKLTPNGEVVSDFGVNGAVKIFFEENNSSVACSFCISSDNKITVVGLNEYLSNATSSVCVKQFLWNGLPDSAFANNGLLTLSNVYSSLQYPRAIKTVRDNQLFIVGSGADTNDVHSDLPMLIRLFSNGQVDSTFGENGLLTLRFPDLYINASRHVTGGVIYDVLELPDSSYLVAGGYSNSFNLIGFIAHIDAFGNLDSTWMQSGYLSFDFSPFANNQITKLIFSDEGEIWFSANSNAPEYRNFYGGKLNLTTQQYTTATVDFSTNEDVCNGILFLNDGNPLFYGKTILKSHNSPVYQGDYFAFTTFNKNYFPILPQPFTFTDDTATQTGIVDAVLQSSGNVVSLGFQTNANGKNQTTLLAILPDSVTSVVSINGKDDFFVFPNPANSYLNMESDEEIQSIQVADVTGRIIISQTNPAARNLQLATEMLDEATYFIHIKTTSGRIAVKSFVKQ
jgi:hypothetical protein